MLKARGLVHADHHMFFLADDVTRPRFLPPLNGLIAVDTGLALVFTGVSAGVVDLEMEGRESRPTDVSMDGWDEVVEISIKVPSGRLAVAQLMSDPPDLPVLTAAGPGHYRVRVHARGRDTMPDGTAFEPVEAYQITVWPEPERAEVVYKQSDQYGAEWRRTAPTAVRETPEEDDRLRRHNEALRRAGGVTRRASGGRG